MLTLTLVTLFITLASVYAFFFVTSKGMVSIYNQASEEGTNAIIEPFFLQFEHHVGRILRNARHKLYTLLVQGLDRFVPWFRKFTKSFEVRLISILQTLKGKRELNYLGNKKSASQYVEDLRNHADESGHGTIE